MSAYENNKIGSTALRVFLGLYGVTQVLAVTILILMTTWTINDRGGFGKLFNWHPFLAVTGLVLLQAQSILIYRAIRDVPKRISKLVHVVIHFAAIACAGSAVIIVIKAFKLGLAFPKSLHGILGVVSVLLFVTQYVAGLIIFLYSGTKPSIRALALPIHVYLGVAVFVLSCITALLMLNTGALTISLLVVVFALFVTFTATSPAFRRRPLPEEIPPVQDEH